jgi:gliding motility-associated lipoprotein GldH
MRQDQYFCGNYQPLRFTSFFLLLLINLFGSCHYPGYSEKNVSVPRQAWASSFQPAFTFEITDTLSLYRLYVVLRHTDAYPYKNIWIDITSTLPGEKPVTERRNLMLATDDQGWLGKGMDDLYEHRILLNQQPAKFRKSGTYTYTLHHLMREDPLPHLMNIGMRVEKVSE